MRVLDHKHPRAIRWLHWINFPILALMIYSGLLIYWAETAVISGAFVFGPYRIGVGGFTLFHFFPQWFYDALGVPYNLAKGMAWHFFFMWIFAINGALYVAYTLVSGEWRTLVPNRRSFREAIQVTLYDLHLSKTHPPPRKYNGAQQIAYTAIILMGAGSLATGLAIYRPVQFGWVTRLLGGYEWARWEHFWLTIGYVAFFGVHVAQVIRAGWNNFRSMVTGYEIVDVEEVADEPV
jgi:thiosulfate reductase cytochrome b subunit